MAPTPVLLLLLCNVTFFIHSVTSVCNVTCSTDYDQHLNCSCSSVPRPGLTVLLEVKCSDEGNSVVDRCRVLPPRSWCAMQPRGFHEVTSTSTNCTATATPQGDGAAAYGGESHSWMLYHSVKPEPPFDVQVASSDGSHNITWNADTEQNCLTYRVRIRASRDPSKDPAFSLEVEEKSILLEQRRLRPGVSYVADVQAKMCPTHLYLGPWSEWSQTVEWETAAEFNGRWLLVSLPIVFVLALLLLFWQRRPSAYVPKPNVFFQPLYLNYDGNFQAWVKPVFSEYDYAGGGSAGVRTMGEKQHIAPPWIIKDQGHGEGSEAGPGGSFLQVLQPDAEGLQDGSAQGTGQSAGHISIHTVTLSEEGELEEEEAASLSSMNAVEIYENGESFNSYGDDGERAGYDLEEPGAPGQIGMLPQQEDQIPDDPSANNINVAQHDQFNEPVRISLESLAEHSEDGYPHMDLDTIDSGFGECGSPAASDSSPAEPGDADLFHGQKNSSSNYVKQWMI